jgi:hypothetical protein
MDELSKLVVILTSLNNPIKICTLCNKHPNWSQYTSYDWRSMLKANGLQASIRPLGNYPTTLVPKVFLGLSNQNWLGIAHTRPGLLLQIICSIILSCFTIQHDAMEITVTYNH